MASTYGSCFAAIFIALVLANCDVSKATSSEDEEKCETLMGTFMSVAPQLQVLLKEPPENSDEAEEYRENFKESVDIFYGTMMESWQPYFSAIDEECQDPVAAGMADDVEGMSEDGLDMMKKMCCFMKIVEVLSGCMEDN